MRKIHRIGKYEVEEFDSNIYLLKNVIDEVFCDDLIKIIDNVELEYGDWRPHNNLKAYSRRWEDENLNSVSDEIKMKYVKYREIFYKIYMKMILFIYGEVSNCPTVKNSIPKHCGWALKKIVGQTRMHIDGTTPTKGEVRCLTCIIGLNSNYENGMWTFPEKGVDLYVKKGDVLLFPPFWTHRHTVEEPLKNPRYTLSTWFLESDSPKGYVIDVDDK